MSDFEPRVIESAGKTVDEAIFNGLMELGVAIDEVDIATVQEATKGVLGIGAKPHIVRLTERDPRLLMMDEPAAAPRQRDRGEERGRGRQDRGRTRQQAPAPREAFVEMDEQAQPIESDWPRQQSAPAPPARRRSRSRSRMGKPSGENTLQPTVAYEPYMPEQSPNEAAEFLNGLLAHMDVPASLYVAEEEGIQKIKIISESMGILIGHRGETLDAMQYITSLTINRGKPDYQRVSIDTENYRSKREETLGRLARKIAAQVRTSGQSVTLEPMNPYERRILHAALQHNPHVTTHSVGEEPNRSVVVEPTRPKH